MGKKKPQEPPMEGAPEWVTTFVDMISLLVTFFILLFTFSSIQEYEVFTFRENILGTRGTIETKKGETAVDPPENDIMSAMDVARGAETPHARPLDKLGESLEEMGQKLTEDHIEFDPANVKDGIVIRFGDDASFGPGSAEVSPTLRKALTEFGKTMQHYPNLLVVEGFTDSEFKPSVLYPTAASLSIARAMAAARVVTDTGVSAKLVQVAGLGMARPLNENATPTERTANRRVEVRILSPDKARAGADKGGPR